MNSGKPSAAIRTFHQLVASPLPVSDAETTPLMTAFHRQVAAGRSVAEALSSAQERIRGDGDARTEAAGRLRLHRFRFRARPVAWSAADAVTAW
jgi:CHAT domain-containing protein